MRDRLSESGIAPELLLVAFLWAAVFTTSKVAVHAVPSLTVATLRFGLASLVLLPLYVRERRLSPGRPVSRTGWLAIAALALTAICLYNALYFGALAHAPSTDAILLVPTTNPVWTVMFAWLLLQERPNRRLTLAISISLLGMLLVLVGSFAGEYDRERVIGNLMAIGAAVIFGSSHVVSRFAIRHVSPLGATALAGAIGSLVLLPFAFIQGGVGQLLDAGVGFWLSIAFIAFCGTALAYVLWYRGVRSIGAGRTAFYTNLVPVIALALAALFLDERPAPLQVLGGAVMLLAVVWGSRQPQTVGAIAAESPAAR